MGQTPTPDATYKIIGITLEYEIITQLDLAKIFQNTKAWFCCMTELSDTGSSQLISRVRYGIGNFIVNP